MQDPDPDPECEPGMPVIPNPVTQSGIEMMKTLYAQSNKCRESDISFAFEAVVDEAGNVRQNLARLVYYMSTPGGPRRLTSGELVVLPKEALNIARALK